MLRHKHRSESDAQSAPDPKSSPPCRKRADNRLSRGVPMGRNKRLKATCAGIVRWRWRRAVCECRRSVSSSIRGRAGVHASLGRRCSRAPAVILHSFLLAQFGRPHPRPERRWRERKIDVAGKERAARRGDKRGSISTDLKTFRARVVRREGGRRRAGRGSRADYDRCGGRGSSSRRESKSSRMRLARIWVLSSCRRAREVAVAACEQRRVHCGSDGVGRRTRRITLQVQAEKRLSQLGNAIQVIRLAYEEGEERTKRRGMVMAWTAEGKRRREREKG
ncbi:hypothetical protein C8R47DRAFT_1072118 [Mycena vitilis]|nr:hypothetical protein C8R47DRAFT_1072118 [Mycena vitilis]